jgi:hypothetical protein
MGYLGAKGVAALSKPLVCMIGHSNRTRLFELSIACNPA